VPKVAIPEKLLLLNSHVLNCHRAGAQRLKNNPAFKSIKENLTKDAGYKLSLNLSKFLFFLG